jgi:hypothetical protein
MTEPTLLDAPREPIRLRPGRAREVRPRDLIVRFTFGAATSVVSAIVSLTFGARAGGLLLAFPAILAASLTLIAKADGMSDAREDARGAVAGAIGLGCFALVGARLFGQLPGGIVLALASGAWIVVAIGINRIAWS